MNTCQAIYSSSSVERNGEITLLARAAGRRLMLNTRMQVQQTPFDGTKMKRETRGKKIEEKRRRLVGRNLYERDVGTASIDLFRDVRRSRSVRPV